MAETQHDIYYIEEIAPGSFKICEQRTASMYLVCGREKACLIDTAFGLRDLRELTGRLTRLPVTVVNTHGHEDHTLGNQWFYGNGTGSVYMHPADRPMYEEITSGFAAMLDTPWVKEQFGEFIRDLDPASVHFPPAKEIREGDVINLGGKTLEIVEMPGHTAGSIILLDRQAKICYSGDAILEHVWMFLEESLTPEIYLDSLRHARDVIRKAGIERIFSGHYHDKPVLPEQMDNMIAGMESIVAGKAVGEPFENMAGTGIQYTFGGWEVLCRGRETPAEEKE